jgi:hypothetical protein
VGKWEATVTIVWTIYTKLWEPDLYAYACDENDALKEKIKELEAIIESNICANCDKSAFDLLDWVLGFSNNPVIRDKITDFLNKNKK